MPFLHPCGILKGSGVSLSSTLNFFSYSFLKSCSTSKAVFIGIIVFSIAEKQEQLMDFSCLVFSVHKLSGYFTVHVLAF